MAWPRWYRAAIDKSARQLAGAEKFLREHPKRAFLDKACQAPLPIDLPDPSAARYYLIAVTRGSHYPARDYFGGGSSGSVMLFTHLVGKAAHEETPFQVGYPLKSRRFVHVLDEMTVDILLEELDTVPDLVSYLQLKEEFLQQPDVIVSAPGEEELLARYMSTLRDDAHGFPNTPKGTGAIALPEGDWSTYAASPQRAAKREADKISYMWDALIEHQSSFIRSGKAITVPWQPVDAVVDHERIVRALAAQPRLVRRSLSADLHAVMQRSEPGRMAARVKMAGSPPSQAFVFLTIPRTEGEDYNTTYRGRRMHVLTVYCHAVKDMMPTLKEAIGVASEPFSEGTASQDFMHVDISDMSVDEVREWRRQANELNILRPTTEVKLYRKKEQEFPAPYRFVDMPPSYLSEEGRPLNRAERRQAEKDKQREAKKRPR